MLRHVVTFRWTEGVDEAAIERVERSLGALPSLIDSIRRYEIGRDLGINPGNADFVVVADFDDESGYLSYRDDPTHQEVIARDILPIVAERTAVQYAVDV